VALTLGGALALVALVGWWDDRQSLPVLPRLAAQVVAVAALSIVLLLHGQAAWWWLLVLLPLGVWGVNLHNFMDGIDGLLALQGMFVAAALGALAWSAGQPALAAAAAVLALATCGFWVFNRPPARIFMGDVGSGSVGLLIFALAAMLWRVDARMVWPALIVVSAFNVDAGLTLFTRMLRGRRWYTAHREHLYQWLVRRGVTHARTGAAYLGWNVLVAAPMAWLAAIRPAAALPACLLTHVVAAGLWLLLKRRLVRRHPQKVPHVVA
jgi:UDP-N-acetylmuramyl pentapeptide phosphotransferase/UDP-N-acetylglucosamine-1-phosphate transferase